MKTRPFFSVLPAIALLIFMAGFPWGCTSSDNQKTENAETDQAATDNDGDVSTDFPPEEGSGLTADASAETEQQANAAEVKSSKPAAGQGQAGVKPQASQKEATPKHVEKSVVEPPETEKPVPAPKMNTGTEAEQPAEKPAPPKPALIEQPDPTNPAVETPAPKPASTKPPAVTPEPEKPTEVTTPPVSKPVPVEPAPSNPTPKKGVWTAPASSKNLKNPVAVDAASLSAGKKAYKKECLSCHGKKGKGNGPSAVTLDVRPPSLLTDKVKAQTDGELFWKITKGKKPMSSAKKSLTETQRWQVVNYIRQLAKNAKGKHRH